jgi:hypothetical protein
MPPETAVLTQVTGNIVLLRGVIVVSIIGADTY